MNIKAIRDNVVVEPTKIEEKTSSGIIIPDTAAREKYQKGVVLAAGEGKKDEPMTVKVGDIVLYDIYAGKEISVEGKDYTLLKQSDLIAIYEIEE